MNEAYKKQVGLLLSVLPEVAKETCFALHGGTAINLFVREMPRLSVDIDLTYVEIAERQETLDAINVAFIRIKNRIEGLRPSLRIHHKDKVCKLQIDNNSGHPSFNTLETTCGRIQLMFNRWVSPNRCFQ